MPGKEEIRERIIEETTALIEETGGDAGRITARAVASRSGVALGLINYYFGNKETLVAECVQRIIRKVILGFDTSKSYPDDRSRLEAWAQHVFAFLFAHPEISRISILSDMSAYTAGSNSAATQKGFALALAGVADPQDRALLALILTSAMQAAFLGKDVSQQLWGFDFSKSADRDAFISRIVGLLIIEKSDGRTEADGPPDEDSGGQLNDRNQ